MAADDDRVYRVTPMLSEYVGEHILGNAVWGTAVEYPSDVERRAFALSFRSGKIYDSAGDPFDASIASTLHSNAPRAIFVMDQHGDFFASKHHAVGSFHHSSLVGGAPVAAAGEIEEQRRIEGSIR